MDVQVNQDLLRNHQDEVQRHLRRNFLANGIEGGIYIGGVAFVQPDSVLTKMLQGLGAPDILVALTPVLMFLGFMAPQAFMASHIERLPRMKPLVMFCGIFQRLPFLVAGLLLFFFHEDLSLWGRLTTVALVPFLSGFFGGLSIAAWQEFIAKTIPPHRRTSLWALRNIIAAFIGAGAGLVVKYVLDHYPGAQGLGILHIIAWVFLMVSFGVFAMTHETSLPPKRNDPRTGWLRFVREMPIILRDDRRLIDLLLSKFFGSAVFIMVPYLSIHALGTLGKPESFLGFLVIAQMLGMIGGNVAGAIIGDRIGGKAVALIGTLGFMILALSATWASSAWHFLGVLAIFGVVMSMQKSGIMTLSLEVAPIQKRVSYLTIQGVFALPGMLLAALMAAFIRRYSDGFVFLAFPAAVGAVLSLYFLLRVMEPRSDGTGS